MRQVPREREREREREISLMNYGRRNNLSLIYIWNERGVSMDRVYFAVCLVLSAPDFTK